MLSESAGERTKLLRDVAGVPNESARSLCCDAFITCAAQFRCFGDVPPQCPGCGDVDTQWHRMSSCERTRVSRERFLISDHDCGILARDGL